MALNQELKTLPNFSAYYAGRPTKYTPELVSKAIDYLTTYNTQHGHIVPTVAGLAKTLGIHKDTVYTWAKQKDKKPFSVVVNEINQLQEVDLVNGALESKLNPGIAKIMLAQHGYTESAPDQGVSITVDRKCGRTTISKGKDTVTIQDSTERVIEHK